MQGSFHFWGKLGIPDAVPGIESRFSFLFPVLHWLASTFLCAFQSCLTKLRKSKTFYTWPGGRKDAKSIKIKKKKEQAHLYCQLMSVISAHTCRPHLPSKDGYFFTLTQGSALCVSLYLWGTLHFPLHVSLTLSYPFPLLPQYYQ